MLKIDKKYIETDFNIKEYESSLINIKNKIINKDGLGNEFLGWYDLAKNGLDKSELEKIKHIKKEWITLKIEVVVFIGIGGSFIGTKAGIEMIQSYYDSNIEIIYLTDFSNNKLNNLKNKLKNKNWALTVVSKSGTTLETSINFRILREELFNKYQDQINKRIVFITDEKSGILRKIADNKKYMTLKIPSNIGGRFSALTSVGIFALELKNVNINQIFSGSKLVIDEFENEGVLHNKNFYYVSLRDFLINKKNKFIEVFANFDENLDYISEHYKQIFAESEGKKENIVFPTISHYPNDLHSIGQYYQEGSKNFFETILYAEKYKDNNLIKKSLFDNDDELDYLENYEFNKINEIIATSLSQAHFNDAKINVLILKLEDLSEKSFGYIYTWLCLSASISAYLNDVNPFNQPGVENYKKYIKKNTKNS